jgi:hypothetical protein
VLADNSLITIRWWVATMNKYTIATAKKNPREIGRIITKALQGMLLMLLAGLTADKEAWASPVLAPGSTYVYAIYASSIPLNLFTNTVDGVSDTFTMELAEITINEYQLPSDHGYKILIQLRSDRDIFPMTGDNGYLNIGGFVDPLVLVNSLTLTSTVTTFLRGPSLSVLASWNGAGSLFPWNGYYPAAGIATAFPNVGGFDVRGIDLVFNLIPEPTSLALLGLGLFAMAGRREKSGN